MKTDRQAHDALTDRREYSPRISWFEHNFDQMEEAGLGVETDDRAGPVSGRMPLPEPTARRRLAAGMFLAFCLVAGTYVIVTLAEWGWRLVP